MPLRCQSAAAAGLSNTMPPAWAAWETEGQHVRHGQADAPAGPRQPRDARPLPQVPAGPGHQDEATVREGEGRRTGGLDSGLDMGGGGGEDLAMLLIGEICVFLLLWTELRSSTVRHLFHYWQLTYEFGPINFYKQCSAKTFNTSQPFC